MKHSKLKTFGERLLAERKKNRLSASELAKASGISRSYITLMENGKRLPGKNVIPKIAKALNMKLVTIINWYLEDIRIKLT
jgi:transcriptional regulator with XRE-family HTH domain